jgi:CBS domain-containing protein
MEAGDVMTLGAAAVRPEAAIAEALSIMLEHRISGLPVVDAGGALVGLVTEGDFLRRSASGVRPVDILIDNGRGARDLDSWRVEDIMTRNPLAVGAETPLAEVVALMERRNVKRLPVLRDGKVVGVLSRANLLEGLLRKYRMA